MNGVALITLWCETFLGRLPSADDLNNGRALTTPEQATTLLAGVAACNECYAKVNGTLGVSDTQTYARDAKWIETVFPLLTGGIQPTWGQIDNFQDLLAMTPEMPGRVAVAQAILREYPPTF